MSDEVRKRIKLWKADIQNGVDDKLIFYECEHVERAELNPRVNIYLGKTKRLLLCKVCAAVAENNIVNFFRREDAWGDIEGLKESLENLKEKYEAQHKWFHFWR
jgi:hypothetical protein